MYLGRVERATWQNQVVKNWANHKGLILTGIAAGILGSTAAMNRSTRLDEEGLIPTLTLLAAGGFVGTQGAIFSTQRLFFSGPRERLPLIGPVMTGAGAGLILAAGFCPVLDLPNALIAALGETALSCYGIWCTATANFSPPKPQAVDYLPF